MSDLRVDSDQLNAWSQTLRSIVNDLHSAGHQADDAANAVGHRGLASTVHDFADNWRIHRGRTIDELTGMADALDAVRETFADIDSQIASELRAATATAATPATRAGSGGPSSPAASRASRGKVDK